MVDWLYYTQINCQKLCFHLIMKYSDILHLSITGKRGVKTHWVRRNQMTAPTPPTTPPQTTYKRTMSNKLLV